MSETAVKFHAPALKKAPTLRRIQVHAAKGGFLVHHIRDDGPSVKPYIFPTTDKMVKHVTTAVHKFWLGNKEMEPRKRGARAAHHEKLLYPSEYPASTPKPAPTLQY